MATIRKHIPNAITCLNLFCGCIACVMAFDGNFLMAAVFIYIAAVFDFLDGLAARTLHAYSDIGKQLDSLADVISFGLAPGVIMFCLLSMRFSFNNISFFFGDYIPYIAFIIPVFSALRLAKFNVDERQTTSFIGLPTPANAIFWASFACFLPSHFLQHGISVILLILLFSYLLISELPMFSLKFNNLKWKDNVVRYIFILLTIPILMFGLKFLYLVIVLYILMSVIVMFACKNGFEDLSHQ